MSNSELLQRRRIALVSGLSMVVSIASVFVAKGLLLSINFFTNLFYYQTYSFSEAVPGQNQIGYWAIFIPIIGGVFVGIIARYGSSSIRGHGIPEAMENILLKESRIPRRITFLKPFSSAIAIGSGGPFGAEGPIIATGSAMGSWLGQIVSVSPYERKIILAAGAASGMTAIFGTPLAAVVLAIELLLFEYRAKSFVPVAMAAALAMTLRRFFFETKMFFEIPNLQSPDINALTTYIVFGVVMGLLSVFVTKIVYWVEDLFDHLPVHWMWWPAIGGLFVGVIGLIEPRSLGVGYDNITQSLNGSAGIKLAFSLLIWKFISWTVALASGTSGGTLAPLLTLGAAVGYLCGTFFTTYMPFLNVDVTTMSLIGMAALFAGSSRALLASVLFALESTQQPLGITPLLGCCSVAYLVSSVLMKNSIMTEKIVRRGVSVPHEYYGNSNEN